ncbi:MAG: ATP-binding protein [Candidatus Rokuibacteriota bacterium]
MTRVDLVLFGEFRASAGGRPIVLPLRKAQALLVYLALPAGKPHSREHLATLLWGDSTDDQARNSLRQTLFALRTALGGARRLASDGERVWLQPDGVDVDVGTFERLVADGSSAALAAAAALYRGDVLEGLDVAAGPFDAWLEATRQRLRRTATTAMGRLLERQARANATDAAVATAERLLRIDPLQETAHRALIRLYDRQGRRADAIRQYRTCVDLLRRELGTEPEPATEAAYRALVPASAARTATAGAPDAERGAPRTPFVGRAVELADLRRHLARAATGHGGVIALLGEAGIGKTRLTEELIGALPDKDLLTLRGRAYESGRVLPFSLWGDALDREARTRMPELEDLGHAWARDLDPLFPGLRRPSARVPRAGDRLRLFEAMSQFVAWLAAGRTLLVVLEDLHWADDMSLRLLAYLGRRLAGWPVLAIVTARQEELDGTSLTAVLGEIERDRNLTRLVLGPLSAADTGRLARSLAPAGLAAVDLAAAIGRATTMSEGNPFVVTEMMRGALREPSRTASTAVGLPATVRDMIMGRVRRLCAEDQRLVALAAVIGRPFEPGLLASAAAGGELEVAEAVERLVRAGIFRTIDDRLDVAHDRIREAVAANLLPPRRRALHTAVARALEALHPEGGEAVAADRAMHYQAAALWERALQYLRMAGAQAAMRGAYREAVAFFERALTALAHLPETPELLEQAVEVRVELRDWLMPLGEIDRLGTYLEEAEAIARRLADERRWGLVVGHLAHYHWLVGEHARALAAARQAAESAQRRHDPALQVLSNFYLGEAHNALGEYRASAQFLRRNVELVSGEGVFERYGGPGLVPLQSRFWLAFSLAALGEFGEAMAVAEAARRAAGKVQHPYSFAFAEYVMGRLLVEQRALDPALAALEHARTLIQSREILQIRPVVGAWLGYARALSGRPEEGIALLRPAIDEAAALRRAGRGLLVACLVDALRLGGGAAEALTWAEQGLVLTRQQGERGHEAIALETLAGVHAELGDPARAERCYGDGLALAEALEMRPMIARCHLGLGRLQRALGRPVAGGDSLARAARLFADMGAPAWVDEIRRAG